MKKLIFCTFLLVTSCAQVLNPNASRTGVVNDNGHVIGKIDTVHAKKGIVINIENDVEYDGTLKANQSAKQSGARANNAPGVDLSGGDK
jgi:hypothetical protein